MYYDVECPYCNKGQEINHEDGYGYEEDCVHNQECSDCGKTFTYATSISFHYEASKAPCLNEESDHKWKPTITAPKIATRFYCETCDERRDPTKEELDKILSDD